MLLPLLLNNLLTSEPEPEPPVQELARSPAGGGAWRPSMRGKYLNSDPKRAREIEKALERALRALYGDDPPVTAEELLPELPAKVPTSAKALQAVVRALVPQLDLPPIPVTPREPEIDLDELDLDFMLLVAELD